MPVPRAGRRGGVKAARHAPALEPRASRAAGEHGEAPPLTLARRSAARFFLFPSLLFLFSEPFAGLCLRMNPVIVERDVFGDRRVLHGYADLIDPDDQTLSPLVGIEVLRHRIVLHRLARGRPGALDCIVWRLRIDLEAVIGAEPKAEFQTVGGHDVLLSSQ
ncbi:hypothetical protein A0U89_15155 (plasmid) [Kozakia baliensis]|uniref:Uncharacterized protein n=1 Tax=Kozakia baliensis TaxID=153496 RepID=A0A1D8UYL8_9PROT|nr:hypothetical protein A0U89_15155 [Kozakia baliensis]